MATAAQRAYVELDDPILWADPNAQTVLDDALDVAATRLNRNLYRAQFDQAVALLAIHTIRRRNPNIGAGVLVSNSDPVSGGASKSPAHMPAGYPPDWYTTPAGEALIALSYSLTPPTFG